MVDFAGKVEGFHKDIWTLEDTISESARWNAGAKMKATRTLGSNRRRLTRLSSSSPGEEDFSPIPSETTWEHVLEHIKNLGVRMEVDTPPTHSKECESVPMPSFGPRVNFNTVTMYPNPSAALETIDLRDFEEDET